MAHWLLQCVVACLLSAAASGIHAADDVHSESARLNAWFEAQFRADLERSPMRKTRLGVIDHDYDEWDDLSKAFEEETYRLRAAQLDEMREQFDHQRLDESTRLSWRLFVYDAELEQAGYPYRDHVYTFNQMRGVQSQVPAFLINQHRVSEVAHAEAYIGRLEGVGGYLGQAVENARRRFDKGVYPPAFVYEHVLRDAGNVLSGAPFDDGSADSPLFADFKDKVAALDLDPAEQTLLIARARRALLAHVEPGYRAVIAEMSRQQKLVDDTAGAWKLPDGDDYYAYRLGWSTTTPLAAAEIHDLGLRETARIHAEMRAIMEGVGFDGSLQAFFEFMRSDPQFYYDDTDRGRERYLAHAGTIIEDMRGRLDELFLRRPRAALVVKRVEPFRERSAGKAFYQRPAADGSRPGTYYANLFDMNDMPTYQMRALAYHEGIPGHHMQIAIAQELEGVPRFRRFGGYTAYSEGWGLYAEWLPAGMGLYSDPFDDFGRLAMELWRAGRLVVDTGMHDKRWTRQQAIDWLADNTPNPQGDIVKAVERYIVMPGQATAYKIGMLRLQALRDRAEAELGDGFDIREYHDAVLAEGPVPLDVLDTLVDGYIADESRASGQ